MKRLILLITVAMLALAITGCEKEKHQRYYVLYFSATVVDEAGNPIQGICAYPEGDGFYGRSGYSDYRGALSGFAHIVPRNPLLIVIEDVDGEANGGVYESQRIDISDQVHYTTPDEWGYSGSDMVEVGTITLKSKESF